jgi:hypothetical protein
MKLTRQPHLQRPKERQDTGKGPAVFGTKTKRALATIGLGAAFILFPPMLDGCGSAALAGPAKEARSRRPAYVRTTDPFELNQSLRDHARRLNTGTNRQKVTRLHSEMRRGGAHGVRIVSRTGRPPRTAQEALSQGGDCTDVANIVIALLREMGVPGGALMVHFNSAPADTFHMVPYAQLGDRRVIIDLQSDRLGQTAQGRYTTVLTFTFDQAASMYHSEWGGYLLRNGRNQDAIGAYERAVEIFDGDAHVHHNLGVLYEAAGNMQLASRHYTRAAQLNPTRYGRQQTRGDYNLELQRGETAYREGRWSECAQHFQNALDSGESLTADERQVIEQYRDACRGRQ